MFPGLQCKQCGSIVPSCCEYVASLQTQGSEPSDQALTSKITSTNKHFLLVSSSPWGLVTVAGILTAHSNFKTKQWALAVFPFWRQKHETRRKTSKWRLEVKQLILVVALKLQGKAKLSGAQGRRVGGVFRRTWCGEHRHPIFLSLITKDLQARHSLVLWSPTKARHCYPVALAPHPSESGCSILQTLVFMGFMF